MRWLPWAGLGLIGAGIALMTAGVATGQGRLSFFFFIPVFSGSGVLAFLGVMFLFLGLLVFLLGTSMAGVSIGTDPFDTTPPGPPAPASPPRFGGLVMVGPFPLAFGNDKEFARAMLVLGLAAGAVIIVLWIFYFIFALRFSP